MINTGRKVLLCILGTVVVLVLNYGVVENMIIPDPCYYHNHGTTFIFDLFYDLPSVEGFHPVPTKLNLVFTVALGILFGLLIDRIFHKLKSTDQRN